MKPRRILSLLALTVLALAATSCDMPDYQLDFQDVHVTSIDGSTVFVAYSLSNAGSNRLVSVMVCVEVEAQDAFGASLGVQAAWTSEATLDVGGSTSGSFSFTYGSPVDSATAYVTQAAWDREDGSLFTLF